MFKALVAGVAAVAGLMALSLVLAVAQKLPAAAVLAASKAMAPDCERPPAGDVPANAGTVGLHSVRNPVSAGELVPDDPRRWAAATVAPVAAAPASTSVPARDLVVYVHGFNTSAAEAACVGENLRAGLARLPAYLQRPGPDVLVFVWPGEFGMFEFAQAQRNATSSARYLSAALEAMPAGRRQYLVAHSLGSRVVMESLAGLPPQRTVAGVLLVAGAIPATSIRTWTSTTTIRFPAAELWSLGDAATREPLQEKDSGTGEYVAAASRAEHIVVTTAAGDSVLGQVYSLDSLLAADKSNRPLVPLREGQAPRTLPQNLAIGSPFPPNPMRVRYDHVLKDPAADRGQPGRAGPDLTMRPPDPSRVVQSTEWVFDFRIPHASYHELRLDERRWNPLTYWHAPMNEAAMRGEVVGRGWGVFEKPAQGGGKV